MRNDRAGYEPTARQAAAHVLETEALPFAPARMSRYAHWYEDARHESLVAVVAPGEKATVADEVLAFGLAWQHNRDLLLVVPGTVVPELLTRMAWLGTEVRLFQYEGGAQDPHPVSGVSRFQLFSHLQGLPERVSKQGLLKASHETWLEGIGTDSLTAYDRGGYLSWHHEGLQVLQAVETRKGLRIRAGVQYKAPPQGREVFDKIFTTPPTPGETAVINAKVSLAIEDGGGLAAQMREHKMQAILAGQPGALGLTHLWREFPAWRGLRSISPPMSPSGRPGFVDFLGADKDGVLHVVETKIGHEPRVVLQALDYAIWVKANDKPIRKRLMAMGHNITAPAANILTDSSPAPIHLVLASSDTGPAFNAYLAGQIESLSGDCRVHIHLTAAATTSPLQLTRLSTRDMWEPSSLVAKPVVGPRWPDRLTFELASG